jgi:hypothetical protein
MDVPIIDFGVTTDAVFIFTLNAKGEVLAWDRHPYDPENPVHRIFRENITVNAVSDLHPLDPYKRRTLSLPTAEEARYLFVYLAAGGPCFGDVDGVIRLTAGQRTFDGSGRTLPVLRKALGQ